MKQLASHGLLDCTLLLIFRQVTEHNFPLDNITFLSWTHVANCLKVEIQHKYAISMKQKHSGISDESYLVVVLQIYEMNQFQSHI